MNLNCLVSFGPNDQILKLLFSCSKLGQQSCLQDALEDIQLALFSLYDNLSPQTAAFTGCSSLPFRGNMLQLQSAR